MSRRAFGLALGLLTLASPALAGTNDAAKLGLHLLPAAGGTNCGAVPPFPCNDGVPTLTTEGTTGSPYYLFLEILDGNPVAGVLGVSLGIAHDPGISVNSWTHCGTLQFPGGPEGIAWPDSGSGNIITWSTCRNTPVPGDADGSVSAVVGYFYVYAYGPGAFSITRREWLLQPDLRVADCSNAVSDIALPSGAGRVTFDLPGFGYDPCEGPFSPFAEFDALPAGELASLQVKLTPVGTVNQPVATVAFAASGTPHDLSRFLPFERPGFDYSSDHITSGPNGPILFSFPTADLEAAVDSVGDLPGVADGDIDPGGALSLALLHGAVEPYIGFEAIVDTAHGKMLFSVLRRTLAGDAGAVRALDEMACALGMLPPESPGEVTTDVQITFSSVRPALGTTTFWGSATVTNLSGSPLPRPLTLVLEPPSGITLAGSPGLTCGLLPAGLQVLDLPGSSPLAPGASVTILLGYENPGQQSIPLNPRLFAGPGPR